jgi:predicted regulator of Ras-like GTPase activity (Roadblock/LC7/MglB family)
MSITGDLTEVKLLDLVQLICTERDTARLTARNGDDEAAIYVAGGEIVHARMGARSGPDVVWETLGWETGTFKLEKGVDPPRRSIDQRWAPLLLEGLARIEAQRADLGLVAEGLLDSAPSPAPDTAPTGPGSAWGPDLAALSGVDEVVIISREGLGLTYATSGRSEDEGALAAFVGSSAREIGEALSLGALREIRMVLAGERHLVLDSGQGFVGLKLSPGADLPEVIAAARGIIGEGA